MRSTVCKIVSWLYLIRITRKDKLKAVFFERMNGLTQGELIFCESETKK